MNEKLEQAYFLLESTLRAYSPYDTGNLALNGIRLMQDSNGYFIAIGGEVAPYANITNATWSKGKNPNEGWIDKAIAAAEPTIRSIFSGELTQDEYDSILESTENEFAETQAARLAEV